ncbi:hypothetical protein HPB50_027442 [Hyalomma asiaticum]|uniref:Uncharacterized protein n=1 Tax=Hyalomma asiaticum TaxID=266040 RepID=A0ACB7TS47_HYAAI|nr:hypothetical protein HPB50_027442 [Hyalomma asiaticum]
MPGFDETLVVVSLTIKEHYQRVDRLRSVYQACKVAVARMYNKVVRRLFCVDESSAIVMDNPAQGITILNLTSHKVKDEGALLDLLLKDNKILTLCVTGTSAESLRPHAVFQAHVTQAVWLRYLKHTDAVRFMTPTPPLLARCSLWEPTLPALRGETDHVGKSACDTSIGARAEAARPPCRRTPPILLPTPVRLHIATRLNAADAAPMRP